MDTIYRSSAPCASDDPSYYRKVASFKEKVLKLLYHSICALQELKGFVGEQVVLAARSEPRLRNLYAWEGGFLPKGEG